MAVYAIGDVQGCYESLQRLLQKLNFDPASDTLWFVGDLVNRGPRSLEVLRFICSLGERAVSVLGNHDLFLLAVAEGYIPGDRNNTLDAILRAPDRERLLDWLRRRPVLHHDKDLGFTLVHAGLPPQWNLQRALSCAAELEAALRGPGYRNFLTHMVGSEPRLWRDDLEGFERLRFITNGLTRMRYCRDDGSLCFEHTGPPGSQPGYIKPWFELPDRRSAGLNIVFGHWASLGYYRGQGLHGLDSGCVWGGQLTALRLDQAEERCCVECWESRQ